MVVEAQKACSPTPLARFSPPALTARRAPAILRAPIDRLMISSAIWHMMACSMRCGQSKLAQIVGASVALPDLAWTSSLWVWAIWVFVDHAAGPEPRQKLFVARRRVHLPCGTTHPTCGGSKLLRPSSSPNLGRCIILQVITNDVRLLQEEAHGVG